MGSEWPLTLHPTLGTLLFLSLCKYQVLPRFKLKSDNCLVVNPCNQNLKFIHTLNIINLEEFYLGWSFPDFHHLCLTSVVIVVNFGALNGLSKLKFKVMVNSPALYKFEWPSFIPQAMIYDESVLDELPIFKN